ncbi:MAG: uroporphyrin-3 C-methyltransferase [Candidatus Azotimanducaceae bacterium]
MSDNPNEKSPKDVDLNDAFARLEKQVAENNEEAPTDLSPGSSGSTKSKEGSRPAGSGSMSGIFALLLALIALGVASYGAFTAWQVQQKALLDQAQQASYTEQISVLGVDVGLLRSQVGDSARRFGGVETELGRLSSATAATVEQVEARVALAMSSIEQQLGTSSEDWLLAEVEYLLRLANQRVAMEDDVAGAVALFESAEEIISEAQGVVAFDLRQSIANDIAALRAVSDADIQGIFVQLGAISGQVDSLEQKHLKFTSTASLAVVAAEEDQTVAARMLALLKRGVERVINLVDYRASGDVVRPILPPAEEYYLKQNLLLKIQLAQLGLLKGNQDIFAKSLSDAVVWMDLYFDPDLASTKSARDTLATLSQTKISRDLPDVSGSLREIRKLMVRFHESDQRGDS